MLQQGRYYLVLVTVPLCCLLLLLNAPILRKLVKVDPKGNEDKQNKGANELHVKEGRILDGR